MEAEFQGFELQTPLGGISIGRGYSRVAGEDYFRGLAIGLPIGRILIGWRVWDEASRVATDRALQLLARHLVFAAFVVLTVFVLDWLLDSDDHFIKWLGLIWGALVALHLLEVIVLPRVDWLVDRLSAVFSKSPSGASER